MKGIISSYGSALRHIRSSLTTEAAKTAAVAIVGSQLGHCNGLLAGQVRIKSCSPSGGPEYPWSRWCTAGLGTATITPGQAGPALAPGTPSNQGLSKLPQPLSRYCRRPPALVPCSHSSKVHTLTITPVFLLYNACGAPLMVKYIRWPLKSRSWVVDSIPGLE